jgi:hypothetical protein
VPPEVATGLVVVVVGGEVVVVDGDVDAEDPPWSNVVGVVVGGDVTVVDVLGGPVAGTGGCVAAEDVLAPGCSFATATPMTTVPPVARRTAKPVRRRSRAAARRLVSGELACGAELIPDVLRSPSAHGSIREWRYAEGFLWIRPETVYSIGRSRALTPRIDRVVRPGGEAGR